MRIAATILIVASCAIATASLAATDDDCRALWKRADVNTDGVLSDGEAARYAAAMRVANRDGSTAGRITQAEFMDACKADTFAERKADPGAPLKGSNSFTEGQARDRALAHGAENVSSLQKDDDGIWRGTATQAGKTVQIAVDYKGNVVTSAQQ